MTFCLQLTAWIRPAPITGSVWMESATVSRAGADPIVSCPELSARISATVMGLLSQTQAYVAATPTGWALTVLLVSLHVKLNHWNTKNIVLMYFLTCACSLFQRFARSTVGRMACAWAVRAVVRRDGQEQRVTSACVTRSAWSTAPVRMESASASRAGTENTAPWVGNHPTLIQALIFLPHTSAITPNASTMCLIYF